MPITAVVVCRNEAALLPRCLNAVAFCDERIVVDLESTDGTAQTAPGLGARVVSTEWVPIVERARNAGLEAASNDWLLFLDPDEEVTPELAEDMAEVVRRDDPNVGAVSLPWRFYCMGRPLKGTRWGGTESRKGVLVNRRRIDGLQPIHQGAFVLNPGVREEPIPRRGDNFLNHYWIEDWGKFFEKHRRYLGFEGEASFAKGERFSWPRAVGRVPFHFYDSLVRQRGYRDGLRGLFLSLFWAAYNFAAILSLRAYEKSLRAPNATSPPAAGA